MVGGGKRELHCTAAPPAARGKSRASAEACVLRPAAADAEPNTGDTSSEGLEARMKAAASDGIFTTVIGVGLDFNTQLVESIVKNRGANYYSVHSPGEWQGWYCWRLRPKRRATAEALHAVAWGAGASQSGCPPLGVCSLLCNPHSYSALQASSSSA